MKDGGRTTPESKLELIDGQLIISTLAGSRRVAWYLLNDYGPAMALPLASAELWWTALTSGFQAPARAPHPRPSGLIGQLILSMSQWNQHRQGPYGSVAHRRVYGLLRDGLYYFAHMSGLGRDLGRDFVIRLGDNGLTPDLIFIDRDRLANLRDYYLDGPPALVIEITLAGSADRDRNLKRQLYEQTGVPEYWLIEPETQQIIFYHLEPDGRYHSIVVDSQGRYQATTNGRYHQETVDSQGVYYSMAIPGLALSVPHLWSMDERNWEEQWWPFLPVTRTDTAETPKTSV